jgi:hypothetical protein
MSSPDNATVARERFTCPTCHAEAGQRCRRVSGGVRSSGKPMKTVHGSRSRLAEQVWTDPSTIGAQVAERDDWRCFRCGRNVHSFPSNCHHRMLDGAGGPDSAENRITLCGSGTQLCHGWVHNNVTESQENGWLISRFTDPADIPGIRVMRHGHGWVYLTSDLEILTEQEWRDRGQG